MTMTITMNIKIRNNYPSTTNRTCPFAFPIVYRNENRYKKSVYYLLKITRNASNIYKQLTIISFCSYHVAWRVETEARVAVEVVTIGKGAGEERIISRERLHLGICQFLQAYCFRLMSASLFDLNKCTFIVMLSTLLVYALSESSGHFVLHWKRKPAGQIRTEKIV